MMGQPLRGAGYRLPIVDVAAGRESWRRVVVRLVFLIFLLVIAEGALRKWVAPQLGAYIFFIRDPFLLLAYALAFVHGLWPRRSVLFMISLAMMVVGLLLAVLQAMIGGDSELRLILSVYGWRNYFLYVPLAFLVGEVFKRDDLRRLYALILLLTLPVSVLVTAQFFSPPGAPINVGVAEDREFQFVGLVQTAERTRPMGPFSSGAGQIQFVGTAFAVLLAMLISRPPVRKASTIAVAAGLVGTMTCLAFSGSRGTIAQCIVSGLFALGLGLLGSGGGTRAKAVVLPLLICFAALTLYPIVFPEGFAAITERVSHAHASETQGGFSLGILGRAFYGMIDFVYVIERVPLLGYGLGYGGNASNTLRATIDGVRPALLAETDFARHMVDLGPFFGVAYISFRVILVIWMAARVLRVSRQSSDPMPMLLLSYVAVTVGFGQITGQGAINAYGWLFAGLLLAACKHAPLRVPVRTAALSERAAPLKRISMRLTR